MSNSLLELLEWYGAVAGALAALLMSVGRLSSCLA